MVDVNGQVVDREIFRGDDFTRVYDYSVSEHLVAGISDVEKSDPIFVVKDVALVRSVVG